MLNYQRVLLWKKCSHQGSHQKLLFFLLNHHRMCGQNMKAWHLITHIRSTMYMVNECFRFFLKHICLINYILYMHLRYLRVDFHCFNTYYIFRYIYRILKLLCFAHSICWFHFCWFDFCVDLSQTTYICGLAEGYLRFFSCIYMHSVSLRQSVKNRKHARSGAIQPIWRKNLFKNPSISPMSISWCFFWGCSLICIWICAYMWSHPLDRVHMARSQSGSFHPELLSTLRPLPPQAELGDDRTEFPVEQFQKPALNGACSSWDQLILSIKRCLRH